MTDSLVHIRVSCFLPDWPGLFGDPGILFSRLESVRHLSRYIRHKIDQCENGNADDEVGTTAWNVWPIDT